MSCIMDPSYSLHSRAEKTTNRKTSRRRKRKVIPVPVHVFSSYKYICYSCKSDVYFLPGQELMCSTCSSRIVMKVPTQPMKRILTAR